MLVAGPRLLPYRRRAIPAALLALSLAAGCAGAPAPAATAPSATAPPPAAPAAAPAATTTPVEAALPPILRGLDLTPAQADLALRINAELESAAEPLVSAANDLGHSMGGAARKCKGESPFVEMDAARVIREGEALRAPVLDAIQRVHGLLTPAQRRTVSDRLVEGDDWAKRERRNASRTRDLAPVLDLSTMQVMSVLMKAAVLWTSFADRIEPWRVHYRTAITDFARDDFDVHKEPVAAVPVVALTLEFVRAGLRQLVPLLEPAQCEALDRLIDAKLEEQATRSAGRAAARARAAEHR